MWKKLIMMGAHWKPRKSKACRSTADIWNTSRSTQTNKSVSAVWVCACFFLTSCQGNWVVKTKCAWVMALCPQGLVMKGIGWKEDKASTAPRCRGSHSFSLALLIKAFWHVSQKLQWSPVHYSFCKLTVWWKMSLEINTVPLNSVKKETTKNCRCFSFFFLNYLSI